MNSSDRPTHINISTSKFIRRKLALAIASQLLWAGPAIAAPTGGQVVGGAGSIEQSGRQTTVRQDTDRLAVDWQTFDVGVDERVDFVQPGQSSVALNRILGNNGSQIQGQINANGHVILVNPNGIVFSKNATVNAGGLIASGLQINPDDFINGDLVFKGLEGTEGTVINAGILNASVGGNVALLGKSVENRGLISAKLGRVHLAAGEEAVLTFDQQGLLGVQIDKAILQEELGGKAAVNNSGTITAEEGQILLNAGTAKDVFSQAVNWGDQRQARSVTYNDDGSFTLGGGGDVVNSGTLDASGEKAAGSVVALGENVTNSGSIRADVDVGQAGNIELHATNTAQITGTGVVSARALDGGTGGDVKLQGKNIGLFDQSSVDASGANGGGTVLVGGDREGLNDEVRDADFVYASADSSINVSADVKGDGGKLILFAEDTARIYGSLAARGGNVSGNGGFVETSGKKGFEIDGAPDISAANGHGGHWLIDPHDLSVVSGFGDFSGMVDGGAFTSSSERSLLAVRTVREALQMGDVTIKTGEGESSRGDTGNINISSAIALPNTINSDRTLNLIAHNNININANITAAKSPDRKLNINLHANTAGNTGESDGRITIADGVRIETSGGDFTVGAIENDVVNFDVAGALDVSFSGATIDVVGAYTDEQLSTYFPTSRGDPVGLAPSGRIVIHASQDVVLGAMQVKGREREDDPAKMDILAGRDITLAANLGYDNNPTEVLNAGDIANDGYSTLRLNAGRNIALNGNIEFLHPEEGRAEHQDRLHIHLSANANDDGVGNVVLGNNNGVGTVRIVTAGGDLVIDSAVDVRLGNDLINTSSMYGGGGIHVTASGDVTVGTVGSRFNFGGRTDDNLADNLRATNIDVTADGDITLTQDFNFNGIGGGADYSSSNPSPSLSFIAGNNLTLNGQIYDSAAVDDAFDYLDVVLVADAGATGNGEAGNEGLLSVARSLYTGGGNLNLSAAAINLNGQALNTDWANGNGGTSIGSTGGHIDIASSSDLTLGNIRTDYDCAALVACGNLVVRSHDPSQAAVDVANDNSRFQISGSVSFDVGAGDVVVNNVRSAPNFDAPKAYQSELIVLSANNVSVEMDNTAHLGDIQMTGDFHLDSEGDVFQVEGAALSIGGAAEFLADTGALSLTEASNRFGGPVAFAGANGTTAVSAQVNALDDLILGATTLSGELTASASGDITQTGVLTVGTATLSAGTESEPGSITLEADNLFSTLAIERASNAHIKNNRGLIIESAQVAESLTLEVDGNVIQGDEPFHLNQLILQITNGTANLLNADNAIGHLSGSVRDGALVSKGPLNLGDFAVTGTSGFELTLSGEAAAFSQDVNSTFTSAGDIIINAPVVALGVPTPLAEGASQPLMDFAVGADLTFNNVVDFAFHGEMIANTENGDFTVNGTETAGEFRIGDSATWQARSFIINGGAGSDTLYAPSTDNQWIINSDNSGQLDNAGGTLLFSAIERLEGGTGSDQFNLSGPATVSLNGGAGPDSITGSNNLNEWQLLSDGNHQLTSDGQTLTFISVESIIGNQTGDTLTGTDSVTHWLVESDSTGTVTPEDQEAILFSLIGRFTGGAGNDTFELAGDALNGVAGGEGDDTFLILTSQSGTLQGDAGSDRFIVGAPDISAHIDGGFGLPEDIDVLVGLSDANNLWTITADDQNALNSTITYTDIERLQGTEMDDTFTFEQGADITLQIAGGDGEGFDELNYSEIEGALDVQLGDNLNHVSGIENILGNNHADSVLTILDGDDPAINDDSYINNWLITGENTGSVSVHRGEARNEVQFSQFAHLKGQAVIDHFDFDAAGIVSGSIDGGLIDPAGITGSRNSLAATDDNTTWTIDAVHQVSLTHTDTDTVFLGETNNISHLVGGDGDDRFIYSINNSGVGAEGNLGNDVADFSAVAEDVLVRLGGADVNGIAGVETLIGNAAAEDALYNSRLEVASTGDNAWFLDEANQGLVTLAGADAPMAFAGFNQWVGGAGADTFELTTDLAGAGAFIDGGAGNDVFKVNTLFATDLSGGEGDDVFQLAATGEIRGLLDGNGGNNTLIGFDGDLTWRISAANTLGQIDERTAEGEERSLIAGASNIQRLQGGVGDDWFFYQVNDSGVGASGGEGTDTADFSGIRADLEVTLGGLDVNGVSGVESLVGNNSGVAAAPEMPAEGEAPVADEVIYNSTLRVVSGDTTQWHITDSNSGSVALGGDLGTMVFKDFNQLIGGAGGDEFVVGAAGTVDGIVGGAGHNRLDLRARTGQVTVNLDTGAVTAEQLAMTVSGMDEVQTTLGPAASNVLMGVESNRWLIDGMGTGQVFLNHNNEQAVRFSGFSALVGGAGADDFQLQAQGSISLLAGAGGANSLQAPDTDNTWQIAGVDRGSLVDSHEQTVVFTQVGTLLGGKGADDFLLLNDTSAITGRIDGGAGVDHIRGAPVATDWAVDSLGLGSSRSINRFQRIETLAGAGGDDSFVLHSLASLTAIDGGAGHNTLDVSAVEQGLILGLQAGDAMADLQLVAMNDIVGSGDDTLRGADAAATWRITGSGAGRLESMADVPLSMTFSGLQKVIGGADSDTFVFSASGALADGVEGGAGVDTLQSAYDGNHWRLTGDNRGDLSRGNGAMVFASIENLTGGWGDDTFDLSATLGRLAGQMKGEPGAATAEQNVGEDTVVGFNADTLWTIDQIGGGSIRGQMSEQTSSVRFAGIEHLLGQDAQDIFAFVGDSQSATIAGLVSGGAPSGMDAVNPDVLDMTGYTGPFAISYGAPAVGQSAINIADIERIDTAPGHQGGLLAANTDNRWEITDVNSGRLCADQRCTAFTDFASLIGGTGKDDFVLLNDGLLTGRVDGGLGEGANRLLVNKAGDYLWQVTGNNSGVVVAQGDGVEQPVAAFQNVAHLQGNGSGDDRFHFSAKGAVESIDGGLGFNEAHFTGRDYRVGLGGASFDVTTAGAGTVLSSGRRIQDIRTGDGDDLFVVSGPVLATAIDAGAGANSLNAVGLTQALAVNLNGGTSNIPVQGQNQALAITGFTEVLANREFDNTLTALNSEATWVFSADGAASIQYDSGAVVGFTGFNRLVGGDQADEFQLNNFVVASLDGGAGDDVLVSGSLAQAEDQWLIDALNKGRLQKQSAGTPSADMGFTSIEHIVGGAGSDRVQLIGEARLTGSVDGGAGNDRLINELAGQHWLLGTAAGALNGRRQNADAQNVQRFAGFEFLQGSGSDTLIGPNHNTAWRMTVDAGVAEGTLQSNEAGEETAAAFTPAAFSGITTVLGGTMNDHFQLSDAQAIQGFIDGGDGVDQLTIGGRRQAMVNIAPTLDATINPLNIAPSLSALNVAQVETVIGPQGQANILLGPGSNEAGYTWAITGAQTGVVNTSDALTKDTAVHFQNFDAIYAGARNDAFQIADGSDMGFIHGGGSPLGQSPAAVDFIDYSSVQADIHIAVSGSLNTVGNISIVGFEGIVGNNDGVEQTQYQAVLAVADGNNHWWLTKAEHGIANGFNEGRLEYRGTDNDTTMVFMNFNHLQGGSGVDRFSADGTSQLTGFIHGGDGLDVFDAQNLNPEAALDVFLNPTVARSGFNLTGVEQVAGHGQNSVLWGSDADSQWRLADVNRGAVAFADAAVNFEQFAHVRGGDLDDTFVVQANGALGGWLHGGKGNDTVTLRPRLTAAHVVIADADSALIRAVQVNVRNDVERVVAEGDGARLQANGGADTSWQITGENAGRLDQLDFTGFTDLLGSHQNDAFIVGPEGRLAGAIDGGLGANTVNLEDVAEQQTVSLAHHSDAHWRLANIQRVSANAEFGNTLIAGDGTNQWRIEGQDAGSVSQKISGSGNTDLQQTHFQQFAHLRGGAGDDVFTVLAEGDISGSVDGGGAGFADTDAVNFSEVGRALTVTLGEEGKLRHIEQLFGNDQLRLFGPNSAAEWLLDGDNAGSVTTGGVSLRFSAISSITGGDANDTFILKGGSLSDILRGGGGDDRLTVDLGSDMLVDGSSVRFDGGSGNDRIGTEGSVAGLVGEYQAINPSIDPALAFAELRFGQSQGELTATQTVRYQNVDNVHQFAATEQMRFTGSIEADRFSLRNSTVAVNDDTAITFNRQSPNIVIDADNHDQIHVDDVFAVANSLTIRKGMVSATADGLIRVPSLTLDDSQGVGAESVDAEGNATVRRIATDVGNLSVRNNTGGVYLQEANGLVLHSVSGSGLLDIVLSDGALSQSTGLHASGALRVRALQGDIRLLQANELSGPLTLVAGRTVELRNKGNTHLAGLQASRLLLLAEGGVNATGPVDVRGFASLQSTGAMTFNHADNQFTEVQAQGPDIQLHSRTSLSVSALDVTGQSDFTSDNNLTLKSLLFTGALKAVSHAGEVRLTTDTTLNGKLDLQGKTVVVDGKVSADTLQLIGQSQVQVNKPVAAEGTVTIDGAALSLNADIHSGSDTVVRASDTLLQRGEIDSAGTIDMRVGTGNLFLAGSGRLQANRVRLSSISGDIILEGAVNAQAEMTVSAGYERVTDDSVDAWQPLSESGTLHVLGHITGEAGDVHLAGVEGIDMAPAATVTAQVGDLHLESLGDLALAQLIAPQQTVALRTSGRVVNSLGAASSAQRNVVAESVVVSTGTGFGEANNRIDTAIADLALTNTRGTVALDNHGALRVSSLHNNGDILLRNDLDVTVTSGSINAFYRKDEPLNPRANGEPSHGGSFDVFIRTGSLRTGGGIEINQPAVSAVNVNVVSLAGDFGGPGLPPVIYAPESMTVTALTSWNRPIWGFGVAPRHFKDNSQLKTNISQIGAGEQLVEVESLEQIDPAIFTDVKNYFYREVSILLPEDQRYEDEL